MSFNVSRNSAFRSFSAIGNSSDMRAASQHELMRKVPIGWGYDIKTFIGALRPPSTTALVLNLRILGFSDSGEFFRQWRRRMNTGAGTAVCSLLKPRGT